MKTNLWPAFSHPNNPFGEDPIIFSQGKGCWLTDSKGKSYLDGVGALEAMVVGHGRKRLADIAARQMETLPFLDVFRYTSQPALDLANKISDIAPMKNSKVHFTPGGSEAVETAMKAAIQFHYLAGEKKRRFFVGRNGAYHGVTFGAMSLGGSYYAMRNDIYLPNGLGFSARAGAVNEKTFGSGARHASDASRIEEKILEIGSENIAGVIVDPMATASGVACPPPEDLVALRNICDRYGVLLIVDEVISAWGHTGTLFASEHSKVLPDIVTVSKGLSSGYIPIGACIVSEGIAARFQGADGYFAHGQTYGGHPVACAVALENIAIIEEEQLVDRAADLGPFLIEGLRDLSTKHINLGSVRGKGLLVGIEIVKDSTKNLDYIDRRSAGTVFRCILRDLGLIAINVHPGNVLLLAPPLIIDTHELTIMMEIIDKGLELLNKASLD